MNPRVTGLLFLVAAALGAFVWFYEIEGEQARKSGEEAAKRLFPGVESDAVEWIALTTSDGHAARLERREGAWRLVAPVDFRADSFVVDGMASALAQLASEASYKEPQPPEVYGLGEGAREVAFGVGGGEHRVRIGARTPIGGNSYLSVGGKSEVHAVATHRVNALGKRLDELRDKRILEFATESVQGLRLRWPDQRIALARASEAQPGGGQTDASEARSGPELQWSSAQPSEESSGWRLVEPFAGNADSATVDSALSNLSFLRATGFEDTAPPDSESGLDRPELEVVVELAPEQAGGEPRLLSLAFGKPLANGDRLVRGAGPALFRVPAARIDDYPRKLVAWRFKDVAHFAADAARKLEMAFPDPAGSTLLVTATRGEDEQWSSAPEAIDPERIRTLVDELARLRARDILADSMGEAELRGLALEPPNASLVVRGADEAALAEVRIGLVREGGGIAAQAAGSPTVFELDPSVAEYVPVSLAALREHFVEKPEEAGSPAAADGEDAADTAEPPAGDSP